MTVHLGIQGITNPIYYSEQHHPYFINSNYCSSCIIVKLYASIIPTTKLTQVILYRMTNI